MGKMYTLQPDESINDHVKESMSIINHIVELSIWRMRDLANPHESTFVDMTYNEFMRSLKHIRESIQMLDELCDELEDDKDEIRHEYEEKINQFFDRFMDSDLDKEIQKLTKKSNQLEEQLTVIKGERDLAKKLARRLLDEKNAVKTDLMRSELECKNLKVVLDKKYAEIEELTAETHEIDEVKLERDKLSDSVTYWRNLAKTLALYGVHATKETYEYYLKVCKNEYIDTDVASAYPKSIIRENNPCNFCGNCRYYAQMGKDDGDFESICTQHYIKRVDPDDASCPHFKSNQVDRDKPDSPCCKGCNRDDCSDCTLCPF